MKPFEYLKFGFMALYAAGVTGFSFWYFFRVTFEAVPEENIGNVNLILGFLIGSALSGFLGYYFGASQSQQAAVKRDSPPPLNEPPKGDA